MIVEGIDHINIPVTNLSKSTSFYSELFDFDIEEESSSHAILDLDPMRIKLIQVDKVSLPAYNHECFYWNAIRPKDQKTFLRIAQKWLKMAKNEQNIFTDWQNIFTDWFLAFFLITKRGSYP